MLANTLVLFIFAAACFYLLRPVWMNKKQDSGGCGSGGSCANCGGCARVLERLKV